jgi:hypothetical protein
MRLIEIGRWSDRSATLVDHVRQVIRCAETSEISGDEEIPLLGRRVCESAFRTQRSLPLTAAMMSSPRAAARSQEVAENQAP